MTRSPHTIGHHRTVADAHQMMTEHGIRHLPVLDGGKLVGVVTDRDLSLVESLRGLDAEQTKVSEAMSADVFTVSQRAGVRQVAKEMSDHKYGSAVVMEGDRVVGVFTTVDALRALSLILERHEASGGHH